MAITTHMCRGNFRSRWVAEGGYDFVAEALFNELDVDGFFMEWDDARSGGFEPLRFVPKGKVVVLGLVTTKKGELETKDLLKRRIEEATQYVDLDQLCLSPQCGFSSTVEGNALTRRAGGRQAAPGRRDGRGGLGLSLMFTRRPPLLVGDRGGGAGRRADDAAALRAARRRAGALARRRLPARGARGRVRLGRVARARDRASASALAFNFFHIPPTGRFTITGGENWVALVVFFVAAVLASSLAEVARRRAVGGRAAPPGGRPERRDGAAAAARRAAGGDAAGGRRSGSRAALGLPSAVDRRCAPSSAGDVPAARGHAPDRDADLSDGAPEPVLRRIQVRIVPSLEALLAAALERDALMAESSRPPRCAART